MGLLGGRCPIAETGLRQNHVNILPAAKCWASALTPIFKGKHLKRAVDILKSIYVLIYLHRAKYEALYITPFPFENYEHSRSTLQKVKKKGGKVIHHPAFLFPLHENTFECGWHHSADGTGVLLCSLNCPQHFFHIGSLHKSFFMAV